jgi:multiple sugar transport system permease protein
LEDSARIDGCTTFQAFWKVLLPLTKPGIVVATVLSFIFSWNIFLYDVVLAGDKTRTLPVAVYSIMNYEEIIWNQLAGAAFLVTLPALILTFFIQRHIVKGLTLGATKG